MAYTDLFLLSFLSRNVKKLIKSSQVNRSKMINYIEYDCDLQQEPFVYIFYKKDWKEEFMVIAKHEENGNDCYQLNASGKTIDIQFSATYRNPVVRFHMDKREAVISSIHNCFLDFFGNSVECLWNACGYKTRIPHLQNLKGCIKFRPDVANIETIENFFSSSPAFKWIDVWTHGSTEPANPESKFYQAESIQILQSKANSPDVLSHFQGKQAVLSFGEFEVLDVISFMNRWKSGEAFLKLEYFKFHSYGGEFSQNDILNAIGVKHIDATKNPPTHCLPKVYIDYFSFCSEPNTDPISSHAYIVRETDNCVASVSIQEKLIYFGVWNKTEDEFLKMVG
ncbi:hypothetical protein B9Z55_010987 [Caenorhabditis nigoni]|nr:hypothetical protein B9Z55_010987 [Caenorhabditis nigoni]